MLVPLILVVIGCGDNLQADPYEWERWLQLEGLEEPYATDEVIERLKAGRGERHENVLGLSASDNLQVIAVADSLIENGFSLRDNPTLDITMPIDWGSNPNGDVNWHFVINAMTAVTQPLHTAYVSSGDERYYGHVDSVVLDWIDYNIARDLPNEMKWYDMATGKRATVVANQLDYHLRQADPDPETVYQLVRAAKMHVDVLRDPDVFTRTNHGLFMMMGLRSLLHVLPEVRAFEAARSYADRQLAGLLDSQFSEEFIHLEHSPSYHFFVTRTVDEFAKLPFFDEADGLSDLVAKARSHHHEMSHPNGDVVHIGDSAGSTFSGSEAVVEYLESDGASGEVPQPSDGYYPDVGYAIFRTPWTVSPPSQHSYLFFDAGFHSLAHRHGDFFTFEWSELGMPVIVDSGKYAYSAGRIRSFFKSTRAGNTVEMDGESFSVLDEEPYGSALTGWGRLDERTRFVEASAAREKGPLRHTRALVFREGDWLAVIDVLDGDESHTYHQWFGFHEDVDVVAEADYFRATLPEDRGVVYLHELNPGNEEGLELARGVDEDGYMQGWISRAYYQFEPRYSAAFSRSGSQVTFVTLLSVGSAPEGSSVTNDGGEIVVSFVKDGVGQSFRYWREDGRGQVSWN